MIMLMDKDNYDVAIIGGGLTGLTAAIYLAQAGKSVIVLEKESELGGLARTTSLNGALFNLGPRAMYEGGAALRILNELGCLPKGGYASKGSLIGIMNGAIVNVPTDLTSEENKEWGQLMGGLHAIDTEAIRSISIIDWAVEHIKNDRVRLFFYAMCRQWAYCNEMSELSAGFVIKQGQLAGLGVKYVEGGWQNVIDKLHQKATKAGVTISTGYKAEQIIIEEGNIRALLLSSGLTIKVPTIITAVGPVEAHRLIQGEEQTALTNWKENSQPLYAACLDIALNNLTYPERIFAIGLDEPLYFSNHSVSVKLSEDPIHILHAMKYNGSNSNSNAEVDEKRLSQLMDLLQPNWKSEIVATRFSANVLIAHDLRTVQHHGYGVAPGPCVPEVKGLYVAGDWVGKEGRLVDAAMASAKLAAETLLLGD